MTPVQRAFWTLSLLWLAALGLTLAFAPAWWPWVAAPGVLVVLGLYDMAQRRHTILRLYPVIGHLRFLMESIRPEIQQYFVEDDISGRPIPREFRSLVYQRAKGVNDTRPFGTEFDLYRIGYEFLAHSMMPKPAPERLNRVTIGGERAQPYDAALLNISAMSFGALSPHAIEALNKAAAAGGFAHNTGEGGISDYHLKHGADLIWQIGTGYFGCRAPEGHFDPHRFAENARREQVKMIEIKLSQGAKPAHGGILPGPKVTPEIARIRGVPVWQTVASPPWHTAFSTPREMLWFIQELRKLSGDKPVGIKLAVGYRHEFLALCKAMVETGITPDYVVVDGGEGGTGAAPIEYTNSVGMPLREALVLVHDALTGCGLQERVRVIASGKILSAFHLARVLALGADAAYSARGMMLALGCIQSRHCNRGDCPTGVATQDPARWRALDVDDKAERVRRYHASTLKALRELVGAAGLDAPSQLSRHHILKRVSLADIQPLSALYPPLPAGCLLDGTAPADWQADWARADADCFCGAKEG